MRASVEARTTRGVRGRCEQGERGKDRRGSTWWTAGPGSWGSSSGSGHKVKVILSSCLVQMQQSKVDLNLTFQRHRLIQLSRLSPLPFHDTLHSLLHLFPSISCSYFLSHFLSCLSIPYQHTWALQLLSC